MRTRTFLAGLLTLGAIFAAPTDDEPATLNAEPASTPALAERVRMSAHKSIELAHANLRQRPLTTPTQGTKTKGGDEKKLFAGKKMPKVLEEGGTPVVTANPLVAVSMHGKLRKRMKSVNLISGNAFFLPSVSAQVGDQTIVYVTGEGSGQPVYKLVQTTDSPDTCDVFESEMADVPTGASKRASKQRASYVRLTAEHADKARRRYQVWKAKQGQLSLLAATISSLATASPIVGGSFCAVYHCFEGDADCDAPAPNDHCLEWKGSSCAQPLCAWEKAKHQEKLKGSSAVSLTANTSTVTSDVCNLPCFNINDETCCPAEALPDDCTVICFDPTDETCCPDNYLWQGDSGVGPDLYCDLEACDGKVPWVDPCADYSCGSPCFSRQTTACRLVDVYASPTASFDACFGTTHANTAGGVAERLLMTELVAGDKVLAATTAGALFATHVVANHHASANHRSKMLTLYMTGGGALSLTPDHGLFVDGALVAAADAKVGSTLTRADGTAVTVERITEAAAALIINPVTISGTILASDSGFTTPVLAACHSMKWAPLYKYAVSRAIVSAAAYFVGDVTEPTAFAVIVADAAVALVEGDVTNPSAFAAHLLAKLGAAVAVVSLTAKALQRVGPTSKKL